MAIVPDDKDWTWVLERQCPECGLEVGSVDPASVADAIRANAATWSEVLARGPQVRERTDPDKWSDLEYGCHVRDVFRICDGRLRLMLEEDDPPFPNWDQDATAEEDRYAEQDPAVVSRELLEAAAVIAQRFDGVSGEQWQRTGTRSDGARFSIATFSQYVLHDPAHHLWDVGAA